MKKRYVTLFISGILVLCLFIGCNGDSDNPANPESTYEAGDVVIIVDNQNPNAVPPPCGTEDAVCGTITDGLLSAARVQDGVPTVLVKPGIYDTEPEYPLQIAVPVILESEENLGAFISGSIDILSSGVTIKGIITKNSIEIWKDGSVTVQDSCINCFLNLLSKNNFNRDDAVQIRGNARIEHSEIKGTIIADGNSLVLNNNVITAYSSSSAKNTKREEYTLHYAVLLYSGHNILNNNTINGVFKQDEVEQTELNGNTIDGHVEVFGGSASLDNNFIIKDTPAYSKNAIFVDNGHIDLTNNTIVLAADDRYVVDVTSPALFLKNFATGFMSNNQFNSKVRGIMIIKCEENVTINTDGTNKLLNPSCWIACEGLPTAPGTELF